MIGRMLEMGSGLQREKEKIVSLVESTEAWEGYEGD